MNERCSAVLLNRLPSKEKDLGSFTIPCDIGQLHINNALVDLGASISLMPYTMYEKLGLGEPKATRMSLELADRSIQYPRGITENVLIKVDKFVLPIDFVILDMPEDSRVLIILGRPFLATARTMIDIFKKKITLRTKQSMRKAQELLANDEPDSFLSKGLEKSIDQSDLDNCEHVECSNNNDSNKLIRRFFQIPIAPEDQEKTTFTYTYGTFAYRIMPFRLCNAPATFQRCMTAIFHDMVEDFIELFMDDFSVLLLQGFDIEIMDKSGAENLAANHLSRLENLELSTFTKEEIADEFPDEHLMALKTEINNDEP
ncbi:reverse transcriptase domain-containing protein, partial [Tanacetum coccineum]